MTAVTAYGTSARSRIASDHLTGCATIQEVDATLARAYIGSLPDLPPDGRSLERVRFCLATLQSPDVRYLVATVAGPDAPGIARVAAAVLRAAGAPTGILGASLAQTTVDGEPIDDVLLARAGTLAAAAGYQLADAGTDRGELSRREGSAILGLTAFAEASLRVALLLDAAVDPHDPAHGPRPDLVVIGSVDGATALRALSLVPEGRPVVLAPLAADARPAVEERVAALGIPALLGDRDHRVDERDGALVFSVRGEPYVTFAPVPHVARAVLATGIASALALGVLGIRMREEWVTRGVASLRAEAIA